MAQMTRGGRALLDQLLADLADIDHAADIPRRDVILDPHGAANALADIRRVVATLRRRLGDDLTPMLERLEERREHAALPERVARLEEQMDQLLRRPDLRLVRGDERKVE